MTAERDEPLGLSPAWVVVAFAAGLFSITLTMAPALRFIVTLLVGAGMAFWFIRLQNRIREISTRDALTKAASRAGFLVALRQEATRSRKVGGPVSLAILDCDSFKQFNESFGHLIGDEVLIETADVLMKQIGSRGTVARLWGDAFGILLPTMRVDATNRLLKEAQLALDARMSQHGWPVTFSIGAITIDSPTDDPQDLLAAADGLMFSVKHRGRDGLAVRSIGLSRPRSNENQPSFAETAVNGQAPHDRSVNTAGA